MPGAVPGSMSVAVRETIPAPHGAWRRVNPRLVNAPAPARVSTADAGSRVRWAKSSVCLDSIPVDHDTRFEPPTPGVDGSEDDAA